MERNPSVATLPLRGGHPALDFANTVNSRHERWGPDVLADYGDLLAWAERIGLLEVASVKRLSGQAAARPREAVAALAAAKRLREAVYSIFSALAAGRGVPAEALTLLREDYLKAQAARALVPEGTSVGWGWVDDPDLDAVTKRIAVATVDLLTGDRAGRVKECFGRNCGWLFLDMSRNGSRRWCSDAVCGSLERVTRHRRRTRSQTLCEEA